MKFQFWFLDKFQQLQKWKLYRYNDKWVRKLVYNKFKLYEISLWEFSQNVP